MYITYKVEQKKTVTIACAMGENGLVDLTNMFFDSKQAVEEYLEANNLKKIPGVVAIERKSSNKVVILDIPEDVLQELTSKYEVSYEETEDIANAVTRERDPEKIANRVKLAFDNGDVVKGRKGGLKYKSTGKALTASEIKYFSERFGDIDKESVPDEFTIENK